MTLPRLPLASFASFPLSPLFIFSHILHLLSPRHTKLHIATRNYFGVQRVRTEKKHDSLALESIHLPRLPLLSPSFDFFFRATLPQSHHGRNKHSTASLFLSSLVPFLLTKYLTKIASFLFTPHYSVLRTPRGTLGIFRQPVLSDYSLRHSQPTSQRIDRKGLDDNQPASCNHSRKKRGGLKEAWTPFLPCEPVLISLSFIWRIPASFHTTTPTRVKPRPGPTWAVLPYGN